ncbi:plasmid partition protein [Streptomyces sp. NPDC051976]|uniref:plasmid partition protein n=1 Tax=Streptomyces sp. NPDC051976 TaxID=3154947 RepID=UPI003416D090
MIIAHISPRTAGKTTSVGWHAHALHERGYPVSAFEADHSRQLAEWDVRAGGFPFPVQQQPSPMFHKNVSPSLTPGQIAVVDCGHAEDHRAIVLSVLRVADLAILNTAPTRSDVDRIERMPMREFIEDVAVLRPDGEPPETWVLLNRTTANSRSTNDYRNYLAEDGWNVFTTIIPNRQMYAQSMLSPVTANGSAYDALVTEMDDRGMLPKQEVHK